MAVQSQQASPQLLKQRDILRAAALRKRFKAIEFFKPYGRQKEFFALGATKLERMFNAGNQLGKSDAGAVEMSYHLTGLYPAWWTGLRFDHPIKAWAAGISAGATRDIIQAKLCGAPLVQDSLGTGLIPKDCFAASPTPGRGLGGSYDMVQVVWHDKTGKAAGISVLGFKSYEQGWQKFQGTTMDFIWLDEEPDDIKILSECQTRTSATAGSLIITFTPLQGETELYLSFARAHLPGIHHDPNKGFVNMTGDDVLCEPGNHMAVTAKAKAAAAGIVLSDSEAMVAALVAYNQKVQSYPAYQRDAKRNGLPTMGSGSVFEFAKADISFPRIRDFPGHWRAGWGVDFGGMGASTGNYSHPFGAVLGHYDHLTDIIYISFAIRLSHQLPIHHADAMKRVCAAAPVFWPHDGHRTSGDDKTVDTAGLYRAQNLRMWSTHATFKNGGYATETGLLEMQQRFASGRLKVCDELLDWWEEYNNYHRDEDGELVKLKDDLMSATRILCMMLPQHGVGVPMGGLNGRSWRDATRSPEQARAAGVDDEYFGL